MNNIGGKRVLITGATAGIGEACARRFAQEGAELILWARRADRLDALASELIAAHGGPIDTSVVDVRDRAVVFDTVADLAEAGIVPHVLVNNAGLASGLASFQESEPDDWDVMIDTNIKGLLNVTRAVLPLMLERGRGHIIHIGSLAGHYMYPKGNVYAATKYAVRALTEGMNLDLLGTPIRMSSVDPGLVETEFSIVRFHGDAERARQVYQGLQPLTADDVADAVFYVANAPPHVNIHDLVMTTVAQRGVSAVHREA